MIVLFSGCIGVVGGGIGRVIIGFGTNGISIGSSAGSAARISLGFIAIDANVSGVGLA